MNSYQKIKPYRNEKYKKFIRSKPCLRCGRPNSDYLNIVPAHQNFGFGGVATKASDLWAVPLCTDCHLEEHLGNKSFWQGYDLKLECLKLINEYLTTYTK